jgi:hypothetical protein
LGSRVERTIVVLGIEAKRCVIRASRRVSASVISIFWMQSFVPALPHV